MRESTWKPGSSQIRIERVRVDVRLGWPAEERATPQPIELDIELTFRAPPRATETDELGDTVCYDEIVRSLRARLRNHEVRLLERLAAQCAHWVRELAPDLNAVAVTARKLQVPVHEVGHAAFTYREFRD